jgi:replicative DNA helicase
MADFISLSGMANYAKAILRDSQGAKLSVTLSELAVMAGEHGSYPDKMENVLNTIADMHEPEQKDSVDMKDLMKSYINEIERRQTIKGMDGLSTGFDALDGRFNGLKPSDLIIVAGRPSMGKTTFALNIADHLSINGKSVLVFSLEMSAMQLADKTASNLSDIPLSKLKQGHLTGEDYGLFSHAVSRINNSGLTINESARTVQQMSIIAKKKKLQKGLDLIVIDYIQLMEGIGGNRTEQIGSISRGLKMLAKDLDVPIMALSQLSRGVESRQDKRPMMSDLRDSGAIEQDADIITFVYRDEYYHDDDPYNKGVAEIITAKYRNGETGSDNLATDLSRSKFKNLINQGYQPYETKKQTKGFV